MSVYFNRGHSKIEDIVNTIGNKRPKADLGGQSVLGSGAKNHRVFLKHVWVNCYSQLADLLVDIRDSPRHRCQSITAFENL